MAVTRSWTTAGTAPVMVRIHAPARMCDIKVDQYRRQSEPRGGALWAASGLPWPGSKRVRHNPLADARGSDWPVTSHTLHTKVVDSRRRVW